MRSIVRMVLVNLALILAAVAAAELIFGEWFSGDDYLLLNIPRNERRLFDVSEFMPNSPKVVYTRDAYGFRGEYGGDPANVDVVVLGGSTTNERYVTDDQTWVARLQADFQRAGIPLRFANASVDGQSSLGHIAAVELWLSKIPGFQPRYALVYVGINDIAVDPSQASYSDVMQSPEGIRRVRHFIMNHSALYGLFRTVRGTWQARDADLMHGARYRDTTEWVPAAHEDSPVIRAKSAARLVAYRERLDVLANRMRQRGWEPIYVTQPRGDFRTVDGVLQMRTSRNHGDKLPDDTVLQIQELFNDVTRTSCRDLALRCIDLARRIALAPDDFYDPIHTTPAGSQKIADFLFGALKDVLKPRG